MAIRIESRHLGEVVVLVPEVYEDQRGFFMETYRSDQLLSVGLRANFVQDNHSRSRRGVIRGLHFQYDPPMGKLMRVTYGCAFLVAVDIRQGSPTLGQWFGLEVSAENKKQVWAPPGFARGLCALSDFAEVQYKCTALHYQGGEGSIRWDDPQIRVEWPIENPVLSEKDREARSLAEWLASPYAELLSG